MIGRGKGGGGSGSWIRGILCTAGVAVQARGFGCGGARGPMRMGGRCTAVFAAWRCKGEDLYTRGL